MSVHLHRRRESLFGCVAAALFGIGWLGVVAYLIGMIALKLSK